MPAFTIVARDGETRARAGRIALAHGEVETPAFMPVGTNATVKAVDPATLKDIGFSIILCNAYHLYLRPGTDVIVRSGGLHRFMGWDGNILTDSGGFQIFSLAPFRRLSDGGVSFRSHIDGSAHSLTPAGVVAVQADLGSDVLMPLDVCTAFGATRLEAADAARRTTLWAKASREAWRQKAEAGFSGLLFGIVQGNFFEDLRRESADALVSLDLPGYAIGGLSVGEEEGRYEETLVISAALLPETKPRYVMGIGTPWHLLTAVGEGIDLFDCVFPTRTARNALAFTRSGTVNLRNEKYKLDGAPLDADCRCPACRRFSRAYFRHLFKCGEILAPMLVTVHNLWFLDRLMREARAAIAEGRFAALARDFLARYESKKNL
ncbi:MAG: tRNA guanosine(34) transglycosylase Tgt [Spirochaetales bacterium]|nr:tRNA guanosine(34) transglycosylase Tgt [Spirochaetales bacterium]